MINNPCDFSLPEADRWVADAACGDPFGPSMFPHEKDKDGVELAKAVCSGCPVRQQCLDEAIGNGEQYGIWGGLTAEERTSLRRKKARAEQVLRKQIQEAVTVNPTHAKVIRGRKVETVETVIPKSPVTLVKGGVL